MADEKFVATEDIFFGDARGYAPGDEVAADVVERYHLEDKVRGHNNQEKKAAAAKPAAEKEGK